ncbi:MAG: PKD domain-containing protein [Candidatus Methanomethylophilaceae archaeon]|nr:PKD domain-containing protein [Candidatus Methanomethylophilaceae archaeon]
MSDRAHVKMASFALMAILAMTAISVASALESDAAWTDAPETEIVDYGEMWGYKVNFEYSYDPAVGNQAQTIEWDFGDGSSRSTDWNTSHTYAEIGTYLVIQHVTNNYNGFSEDWGYYRIHVMGHPYVEIVMPEGAPSAEKIYTVKGEAAERPADPIWEGHELIGYYADPEGTVPFDWDQLLDHAVVAYPKFKMTGEGVYTPTEPAPEEPIAITSTGLIVLAAAGIFTILAAITKRPLFAIIAIILAIVAVIGIFGIVDVPEVFSGFEPIVLEVRS